MFGLCDGWNSSRALARNSSSSSSGGSHNLTHAAFDLSVVCCCSGWGFKAQQVLGAVRGKDFRHEKTKKKRGSYKGGNIDPDARFSYKFESDDE
jgi:hypothetical protein